MYDMNYWLKEYNRRLTEMEKISFKTTKWFQEYFELQEKRNVLQRLINNN